MEDKKKIENCIQYKKLNFTNFNEHSLDLFVRHQEVHECWRKVEGEWKLLPIEFVENWSVEECQEIAGDVAAHMENDQTAFGAFDGDRVVGFITISHNHFGLSAKCGVSLLSGDEGISKAGNWTYTFFDGL